MKSDFAALLRECTPHSQDNSIVQQYHATYNVKLGAELWNQQTRGLPLVYGGDTSLSEQNFCASSSVKKPAVYVEFRDGCRCDEADPNDCSDADCVTALGSITRIPNCDDAVKITVWGDFDTYGSCSSNAVDWHLDSVTPSQKQGRVYNLLPVVTHELGHALNLGHPSHDWSIMSSYFEAYPGRHPFYWEKDCVDDDHVSGGRTVYTHYKSYASSSWSGISSHNFSTDRGNWSGGYWRSGSGNLTYGVYSNPYVDWGYPNTSHFAGYTDGYKYLPSVLHDLDTMPALFSRISPATDDYHWIIYTWANSSSNYYPPYVRRSRSDDFYTSSASDYLWYCKNVACDDIATVNSSYPLSTTWDPYTWQDIFVRIADMEQIGGGKMVIHPGLFTSTRLNRSVDGTLSATNTNLPTVTSLPEFIGPPSFQAWPTGSTAINLFWTEAP